MSSQVFDAYFGWNEFTHPADCRRPVWVVDYQSRPQNDPRHRCADADCPHGDRMDQFTVRLVCQSCRTAFVVKGEEHSWGGNGTWALGYGEAPKRVGRLYLYPGPPLLRIPGESPWEYLVTDHPVDRLALDDVVGLIETGRTPRGRFYYTAAVQPRLSPDGRTLWPRSYWGVLADQEFSTPSAAAKWIDARRPQ